MSGQVRTPEEIDKEILDREDRIAYHREQIKKLEEDIDRFRWFLRQEPRQEQQPAPKRTYTRREKPAQPEPTPQPEPSHEV